MKSPVFRQFSQATLKDMHLIQKGNRLSVMPVTKDEFDEVLKMAD
jgi:predicted RNA-binding protein with PUA-like domain